MAAFLWILLFVSGLVLFTAARGNVFTSPERNRSAVFVTAILCGVAVLGLGGLAARQSSVDNARAALRAQEAKQAHLRRLAWQEAHPREYAARLARQRAAVARVVAEQRAETAREQAARRESDRVGNLPENRDPCSYANGRIEQGWADFKGGSYQAAFDNAVKGLSVDERCDNNDAHQVNEGFLLSIKGMSEHYLSSGDSRTDLHQAETILEECQTNPSFYGTHAGAECETQQENDIKAADDWDVYGS
jgi:hypothetical protein